MKAPVVGPAFVIIGATVKPKSFAGLLVALAVLGLTFATEGTPYAAIEARSMNLEI